MSETPALRVDISPVPERLRSKALMSLDFLGVSLGVRIELAGPRDAQLKYGGPEREAAGIAWIPLWPETYEPATPHQRAIVDDLPCWLPEHRDASGAPDLIGATWRLLTLADEQLVPSDRRETGGVFATDALPPGRQAVIAEPLAEWHAAVLLGLVRRAGVRVDDWAPRWPGDKRYAVLVTHDADGPRLQQPAELAKALGKAVLRRSSAERRAFFAGLTTRLLGRPDPYFGFQGWADTERELGIRSAFYLYVRSGVPGHPRDPVYTIDRHPRWEVLRTLADAGWELGVHAGIRAAESLDGLRDERIRLEGAIGRPVSGLRHHYWRLDWLAPARTFERQLEAGYSYDTSMAWRDRPGFRAGTSLPYFPGAATADRVLPLIEIPTTLMDGHLFEYLRLAPEGAGSVAEDLRERVARAGGVFNIDWHERTFCDRFAFEGWGTVARNLMAGFSSDAWLTTPAELAQWWRTRAATVGLPEIRGA